MDSKEALPIQGEPLPGSLMLRNGRHEAFARARAILVPLLEAAREAGYSTMTPGNAAKIDRSPKVRERVKFLTGNTEDVIRRKRERIERELELVASANMDDFVVIGDHGLPVLDLTRIRDLPDDERRELMAAVKSVRYTENGPTFELHPKLDALAQLRKINGVDEPEKQRLEVTGKDRGPLVLSQLLGDIDGKTRALADKAV